MSKNTTINLRVNADVKKQSEEILNSMGITLSELFNMLLHQVNLKRKIPFEIVAEEYIPKKKVLEYIDKVERGEEELHKFDTWEEAKEWLDA